MRIAMQLLATAAVGILLGAACSDQQSSGKPAETAGGTSSDSGAAGAETSGDAAGAGGANGGSAGADNSAGAGAGGADACEGDYSCPSVIYWSHAIIKVDLPVSVADAEDAVFTACRNAECHSAKGSAQVPSFGPGVGEEEEGYTKEGWVSTKEGGAGVVFLNFDSSGATPFAVLDWRFSFDGAPPTTGDKYSLTIQPVAAAAATALFDGNLQYTIAVADPSLLGEGFCRHCSEVARAMVDARAGH